MYDDEGNEKYYGVELNFLSIPELSYEDMEIRQEVKNCIKGLDIESRQIINLRFYKDLSYSEICQYLGMNEGTLKSKIHRIKLKIASRLEKCFDIEEADGNG